MITNYFAIKKPRLDTFVEIPKIQEPPNVADNIIKCICGIPQQKTTLILKERKSKILGSHITTVPRKLCLLGLKSVPSVPLIWLCTTINVISTCLLFLFELYTYDS